MAYPNGRGYVLDFSDRTIAEYFEDEFNIDFEDQRYFKNGPSKRLRLTAFIELEAAHTVAKVLRALWDRREGLLGRHGEPINDPKEKQMKQAFLDIIADVEGLSEIPKTDALDRYSRDRTLDELIKDIERDLEAQKPEAVMDHLHTYCVKKITHLLQTRGITCDQSEPLHSRFGKYRNELAKEQPLSTFTNRALKSAIGLFESYNDIRNNHSFAHDNPILGPAEARYVFETISAILIFLRTIEAGRYE